MTKSIKKLSPSMKKVEKAICSQLKMQFDNESVIGAEVTLAKVESKVKVVADVPKLCRRMRRAGLINYAWHQDIRVVSLKRKGFKLLQSVN